MATQPSEPFRTVPDKEPSFAGANLLNSGLNFIGGIANTVSRTANELVDPILDFEIAKKKLDATDSQQVNDSTGATKSAPISEPTGIRPNTVNVPQSALVVGGGLVLLIAFVALGRRGK